ncbi:MAG: hypothetical protein Q9163_005420 [Psora crenata]
MLRRSQGTIIKGKERGGCQRTGELVEQRHKLGQYQSTVVGAGLLAMPLAISRTGILLGVFIILWSGLTAGFGLYLQTRCARYLDRGSSSFFALSQITYPNAAVVFDAAIAIKCFGVGVSYLIIIGDLMPGVVRGFSEDAGGVGMLFDRQFWVTGFMYACNSHQHTPDMADRIAMFSVLNEIGNNSHFRTTAVVCASISIAAFIYILVAMTGYLSFGNAVGGNIVALYAPSITSTIGKAAIVVMVMFSYPLQVHPCRASVDALLKWRPKRLQDGHSDSPARQNPLLTPASKPRGDSMGNTRFAAITTAIIVLSYIAAMTVSSLEKVLAYVGSTGSTSISFILPGMFYYNISSPESAHHQKLMKEDDDEPDEVVGDEDEGLLGGRGLKAGLGTRKVLRRLSLALAIYGVVVMISCLAMNTVFEVTPH